MANEPIHADNVPPTPLSGESDAGEVPGLGQASSEQGLVASSGEDHTIPTPMPDVDDDGRDDLHGATDRDAIQGFTEAADRNLESGVGNVEDRGTVAGVGAVDSGDTGTGPLGMEGTQPTAHRSTEPVSKQGSVTGVEDEA